METCFSRHLQVICVFASLVADEGEMLTSYKAMSSEAKQLLEDGLEDKTLANLRDRLAAVQPQHLVRPLLSVRLLTMLRLHLTGVHLARIAGYMK